jgi:chitinase
MKRTFSILIALTIAVITTMTSSCIEAKNDYRVVGYVAGFSGFDFSGIDAGKLTHINYAFANIINGEVMFDTTKIDNAELNKNDLKHLTGLREANPSLKVLISVGGWGWSGNFSDAALNDSTRERFAVSAARFISENNLDGIDLDWEYPSQPGAGNKFRAEDKNNFTLLLKAVREKLSLLGNANPGRNYLLTIATGGDSAYVANTVLGEASDYVDFINIMTYDLHNGNTKQTGHHSNLFVSKYDSPYGDATDRSVKMHLDAGVPAEKINIGIPFYGRRWKHVTPANYGLYQDSPSGGEGIPYTMVKDALQDPSFKRYWDATASAPWLWNSKDSVFISYDDPLSIRIKMEYIKKNKLGGAMFWEYAEDSDGSLLNAIDSGLGKLKKLNR